jgi:hypothetical protein
MHWPTARTLLEALRAPIALLLAGPEMVFLHVWMSMSVSQITEDAQRTPTAPTHQDQEHVQTVLLVTQEMELLGATMLMSVTPQSFLLPATPLWRASTALVLSLALPARVVTPALPRSLALALMWMNAPPITEDVCKPAAVWISRAPGPALLAPVAIRLTTSEMEHALTSTNATPQTEDATPEQTARTLLDQDHALSALLASSPTQAINLVLISMSALLEFTNAIPWPCAQTPWAPILALLALEATMELGARAARISMNASPLMVDALFLLTAQILMDLVPAVPASPATHLGIALSLARILMSAPSTLTTAIPFQLAAITPQAASLANLAWQATVETPSASLDALISMNVSITLPAVQRALAAPTPRVPSLAALVLLAIPELELYAAMSTSVSTRRPAILWPHAGTRMEATPALHALLATQVMVRLSAWTSMNAQLTTETAPWAETALTNQAQASALLALLATVVLDCSPMALTPHALTSTNALLPAPARLAWLALTLLVLMLAEHAPLDLWQMAATALTLMNAWMARMDATIWLLARTIKVHLSVASAPVDTAELVLAQADAWTRMNAHWTFTTVTPTRTAVLTPTDLLPVVDAKLASTAQHPALHART